jgi:hypothetical protein
MRRLPAILIVAALAALFALLGWRLTQAQYRGGAVAVFDRLGERHRQRVPADFSLPFVRSRRIVGHPSRPSVMIDFYATVRAA